MASEAAVASLKRIAVNVTLMSINNMLMHVAYQINSGVISRSGGGVSNDGERMARRIAWRRIVALDMVCISPPVSAFAIDVDTSRMLRCGACAGLTCK